MATFEPNLTQRIKAKAKSRLVPNWRARLDDYSTRIAKWGALLQGALLLLPASTTKHLPADIGGYLAVLMFILVGAAKIITEPGRGKDTP